MGRLIKFEDFGREETPVEINETEDQVEHYINKFEMKMSGSTPGTAAGWIDGIEQITDNDKRAIWAGIQEYLNRDSKDDTEMPEWVQTIEETTDTTEEIDPEIEEAKPMDKAQKYVHDRIAKLREGGYEEKHASTIAHSMARRRGLETLIPDPDVSENNEDDKFATIKKEFGTPPEGADLRSQEGAIYVFYHGPNAEAKKWADSIRAKYPSGVVYTDTSKMRDETNENRIQRFATFGQSLNEGLESRINYLIRDEAPASANAYNWNRGMVVTGNKRDAENLVNTINNSGEFGPARFDPKSNKIEFGVHKQFFKGSDAEFDQYAEKFKAFQVDEDNKPIDDGISKNNIELTFSREDEDTGNFFYKGDDGNTYVGVEGIIHDVTDEMEPSAPVHNTRIKKGEPVYNSQDRFGRKIGSKIQECQHGINESRIHRFATFALNEMTSNEKQEYRGTVQE